MASLNERRAIRVSKAVFTLKGLVLTTAGITYPTPKVSHRSDE